MTSTATPTSGLSKVRSNLPTADMVSGLVVAVVGYAIALGLHRLVPAVGPVTWCVLLGIAYANVPGLRRATLKPGLTFAAKKLLRVGVSLLGLSISVGAIIALGLPMLVLVIGTLLVTFFVTKRLGRMWGLNDAQSLLLGTGFAICGASAIAAMRPNTDADDEDVTVAVALVTLCGTTAMLGLPLFQGILGLSDRQMGVWIGASIHDVGQVVGAASAVGAAALTVAVVIKLTRVLMLAPLVAGVALVRRRRAQGDPAVAAQPATLPPVVPFFIAVFLLLVVVRSTGVLPAGIVEVVGLVQGAVIAVAVFGLAADVNIASLVRRGHAELSLAAVATLFIILVSLGGTYVLID